MTEQVSVQSIKAAPDTGRKLIAIVYADMAGYSRLIAHNDTETICRLQNLRRNLIEPSLERHAGILVNTAGDSLLATFNSITSAVRFAAEVQDGVPNFDREHIPDRRMRFRMGVTVGDAIPDGTDLHGNGVNIAARLQKLAEPGALVVSRTVADEVRGKIDGALSYLGTFSLKNIPRPIEAYRFDHAPQCNGPFATSHLVIRALVYAAVILALLPITSSTVISITPQPTPREEAMRLLEEGRAIPCRSHPCPNEWLAKRSLFERAIAVDPNFARAYAEATFTYTNFVTSRLSLNEKEDLRAAERLATRAAALAPEQAYAHEARAAVLRQDPDRLEDALSAYLRSDAIKPNQPSVLANAGWMLVLLGRPADAEPFLHKALSIAPDAPLAPAWLNYLGLAHLFLEREGHGADLFRRAMAKQPTGAASADARLQRGLNLAAALALSNLIVEARTLTDELRQQYPALSVRSLWNCDCSRTPGFLAGYALLRRGVILAGVPDPG